MLTHSPADRDFPALIHDPNGDPVEVQLFSSRDLPEHWDRPDALEGEQYQRILIPVELPDGQRISANIYVAQDSHDLS